MFLLYIIDKKSQYLYTKKGKDFLFTERGVFYLQKNRLTFLEKNAWWFGRNQDNFQGCLTQSIHLESKYKN